MGQRSLPDAAAPEAGRPTPRPGHRALDDAVFALAVMPADVERLRLVVAAEVGRLLPRAVATLEPAEDERGQQLLRQSVTDPDPLRTVLPLKADGLVVGVLSVRTVRAPTFADLHLLARLGEVVGRRLADAVHGSPQERATVEALRTRETQLLAAQRMASITVWHWRVQENTIEWLDADGRDLGLDGLGKTQEDYLAGIHPDDVEEHNRKLLGLLVNPGSVEVELRYRWDDGWRNWHLWAESMADERGVVQSLWGTTQDVTAQRTAEAAIRQLAVTDSLTGLANRQRLQDELVTALGDGSGDCAVLLLDLDRFKAVNDTLGHLIGDQLLVGLGERLRTFATGARTVGRLGGDEFLIVVPDGSLRSAGELAERVMAAVTEPVQVSGHAEPLAAQASLGIAATRGRARLSASDLYREADIALYAAKDAGRGRIAAYDEDLAARTGRRLTVEAALRGALSAGDVHPLYQPVIALGATAAQDRLTSCEALARLGGTASDIGPDAFVPVAEDTGLIAALDQVVFECAARELMAPDLAAGGDLSVAVNLSPRSLQVPGLVDRLLPTFERLGLDATRLRVEITESTLAEPTAMLLGTLAALRELGATVGIDDFGTGYSALSYLQRFELEFLKVDRSFISRVTHDPRARAVVRALVDLAHAHDLHVVAEGVETVEQLEIVRELGCDKVQGFLTGRPMTAARLLGFAPGVPPYTLTAG